MSVYEIPDRPPRDFLNKPINPQLKSILAFLVTRGGHWAGVFLGSTTQPKTQKYTTNPTHINIGNNMALDCN